jgi:glycine oxidase
MHSVDCIVIGGGVVGCAAALRLAQAGVRTLVLERAIPGAEASSAAAGILAAQEESTGPGPLTELCVASREMFAELSEELRDTGTDIGYRESGLISAGFSDEDRARLERKYAWQRERGWKVEWLDRDAVRERERQLSLAVIGGLSFPKDGQVDPPAYAKALSLAAARAGAQFVSGAYVRRVVVEGGRVTGVELEGQRVEAPHVVIAAGSWSALVDGAGLKSGAVRPLRGQIAQIETRPPAIWGTIIHPGGGYIVGRSDGRVLAGSTMEHVGFDKRVTAGGLRHVLDLAIQLAPSLAEAPVTQTWANFRPTTDDELPLIGQGSAKGLILATGHFRNGILLSPATAEIVRDLVVGKKPRWEIAAFSPGRLG